MDMTVIVRSSHSQKYSENRDLAKMAIFRQLFLGILKQTPSVHEAKTSRWSLDQIYGKNLRLTGGKIANGMDMSVLVRPSEI